MTSESKYMKRAEEKFIELIRDKEWSFIIYYKEGKIIMYYKTRYPNSHLVNTGRELFLSYIFIEKRTLLCNELLEVTTGKCDIRWIRIKSLLIKYFPGLKGINKAECVNIIRK